MESADHSPDQGADRPPYELTERRIARLTLVFGVVAGGAVCAFYSVRFGAGVVAGALLAWFNFRWLKDALDGLTRASTAQAGSPEARVPVVSMFLLVTRYGLIAAAVYAIFTVFKVPVLSMLLGLCALGAATIWAALYEILHPTDR